MYKKKKIMAFLFFWGLIFFQESRTQQKLGTDCAANGTVKHVTMQNINNNSLVSDVAVEALLKTIRKDVTKIGIDLTNFVKNTFQPKNIVKAINVNQISNYVKQSFKAAACGVQGQLLSLRSLIWRHKIKLTLSGALGLYLYLIYKMISINIFCCRENLWSSWKKGASLEELLAIPQKEVTNDLIRSIQSRHIQKKEPSNSMASFVFFIQVIDEEEKQLRSYVRFYGLVARLNMWKIFPPGVASLEKKQELNERLKRIVYIKNIFSTWLAKYKVKILEDEAGLTGESSACTAS